MKGERFVICGDTHGDMQDHSAVRVCLEFSRMWRPTIRVHVGDCFDLRWLRGRASEQERREKTRPDIDAGKEFLAKFRPTHFLNGNHDHRLLKAAEGDVGFVSDYTKSLIDEIHAALKGARQYKYDKRFGVMRLGDYRIVHGYHAGVSAVRQAAMTYGNVVMGHIHTNDAVSIPHIDGPVIGISIGSLCRLDMGYNEGQPGTLRQNHGFAYGIVRHGRVSIWQAKPIGGVWVMPTELREYAHAA